MLHLRERLATTLLAPVRAFRIAYLPLLTVYLASGALGLIAVADSFWVKRSLTLTPAELASLAVWLQLPWTAKMAVSELVDGVPILGSRRRAYIFIGAGLIATGLLLLAGAAGGWIGIARPERIYVLAQLLVVIGGVLQEVVADAISAEVVPRVDSTGRTRAKADLDAELAMVQIQARLAYSLGAFTVAWLAGVMAEQLAYSTVFLIGLVIPVLSVSGAFVLRLEEGERRTLDKRVLATGIALAICAAMLGFTEAPFAQEIVLLVSATVVALVLRRLMRHLDPVLLRRIAGIALVAFAFRAVPTLGDGYRWFGIDHLGFDERFFGILQLTGTGLGLAAIWLMTDRVSRGSARGVLLVLTFIAALLWLPSLLLVNGAHAWTEAILGIGARSLALVDEAAQSPLALLATVPLMTLIAMHAPAEQRATWFALVASLMSLAIVASQLFTKHLNLLFSVDRGAYEQLGGLVAAVLIASLALPLSCLALVWRRIA